MTLVAAYQESCLLGQKLGKGEEWKRKKENKKGTSIKVILDFIGCSFYHQGLIAPLGCPKTMFQLSTPPSFLYKLSRLPGSITALCAAVVSLPKSCCAEISNAVDDCSMLLNDS